MDMTNARVSRMLKKSLRFIYAKLSTASFETDSAKLPLPKTLSWIRHVYSNLSGVYGAGGCIPPKWITDHFAPYCYELGTTAVKDIRMSEPIQRRDRK